MSGIDGGRNPFTVILLVTVLLAGSFVVGDLVLSRQAAFRSAQANALAQVQLLEANLNTTLREIEALVTLVATAGTSPEDMLHLMRQHMLLVGHITNAGVYGSDCSLVGALRNVPPLPPPQLPEELREHHHDRGGQTGFLPGSADTEGPLIWISHRLDPGCVVMAGIGRGYLQDQLRVIHGAGVGGSIVSADGRILIQWGEHPAGANSFLGEFMQRPRNSLTAERRGNAVLSMMQLRSYPLYVSLAYSPDVVLEHWYSRVRVELSLLALGMVVLFLLMRLIWRQQEAAYRAREQEVLIRETNHRVKNNLAIIDSILSLAAATGQETEEMNLIAGLRGRIAAISLIHDALHNHQSMSNVQLDDYFGRLVDQIEQAYRLGDGRVDQSVPDTMVPADTAKRLGLILHELVANAFKYSPDPAAIFVTFEADDQRWALTVQDDGPGFPDDPANRRSGAMGLTLVDAIADELNATVVYESDNGARVTVWGPVRRLGAGES